MDSAHVCLALLAFISDAGANNIFWYEPPPAGKTADSTLVKTHNIQLLKGSTNVSLSWNFTLGPNLSLNLVQLYLGTEVIGSIFPAKQPTVSDDFYNMVTIRWINFQKVILVISIVTADVELSCKVTTGGGSKVWTRNIKLNVVDVPTVTTQNCSSPVTEGDNATLNCYVTGSPAPSSAWIRASTREVLSNNKTHMITAVKRNESGSYECLAWNGIGNNSTKSCTIDVQYRPKIVNLPSEYTVAVHQSATLFCQAEGNPTPSFTWTPCKDGCNQRTLVIPKVFNDIVYTCTVTNFLGNESASTSVVIAGKEINITLTITGESCTNKKFNKTLLSSKLTKEIDKAFVNKSTFNSTTLKTLKTVSCGNLIVDFSLKFNSTVSEKWVLTILKQATKDGKLGEFNVAPSSIKETRPVISSTTSPPIVKTTSRSSDNVQSSSSDSGNTIFIIVGAVLGALVVIAIVVLVVMCACKRKNNYELSEKPNESDNMYMLPLQSGPEKPAGVETPGELQHVVPED